MCIMGVNSSQKRPFRCKNAYYGGQLRGGNVRVLQAHLQAQLQAHLVFYGF